MQRTKLAESAGVDAMTEEFRQETKVGEARLVVRKVFHLV